MWLECLAAVLTLPKHSIRITLNQPLQYYMNTVAYTVNSFWIFFTFALQNFYRFQHLFFHFYANYFVRQKIT